MNQIMESDPSCSFAFSNSVRREKGDEGERGGTGFNEQKANRRGGEVKHGVAQKKRNST